MTRSFRQLHAEERADGEHEAPRGGVRRGFLQGQGGGQEGLFIGQALRAHEFVALRPGGR